jgi:hypothetical protein
MPGMSLRRPSPALVVACVALGVALGGTGYASVLNVPRNSVGPANLKNNAVTTKKIAPDAVTGAKVRNASLTKADFAAGQLPAGPAGPQGPAGPPGLSAIERIDATGASNSAVSKTAFLACPTGKRLIGGGARVNGGNIPVGVVLSFPDNDNVWRASAREMVATQAAWSLTVFAICANAT